MEQIAQVAAGTDWSVALTTFLLAMAAAASAWTSHINGQATTKELTRNTEITKQAAEAPEKMLALMMSLEQRMKAQEQQQAEVVQRLDRTEAQLDAIEKRLQRHSLSLVVAAIAGGVTALTGRALHQVVEQQQKAPRRK